MTYHEMLATYDRLSAAHDYALGFVHERRLYVVRMSYNELLTYAKPDRMSSKRGGWAKVRIRMNADQRKLLATTAELLGGAELLKVDPEHNRGENLERELTERWLGKPWKKNNTPFWVAGDLQVNGVEVQVKYDGAELTNEKELTRLTA